METAAKIRLAAIALETGSAADARRILDAALKKQATAEGLTLNAQLLQREGKPEAALAAAHSALDLNPNAAAAQYVIGAIELDRGNFDTAEQAFRAVLRQNRLMPAANLQIARAKLATGHPGDAIPFAEAAGSDLNARLTLARALLADGQTDRARSELKLLEATHPSSVEPAVLLGSIEMAAGHIDDARTHADRALTLSPGAVDALVLAARTALAARDAAGAERFLERAVARDPSSFEAHVMLAQIYASRGDLARAQTMLEAVAVRRPDVAAVRTALGVVLEAANRPSDARVRYEQALAIDSADPIAANNLARLYASDAARTTEAIELARTAAARMPNDADVYDTLGWIAFKAGHLTMARSALERAVALDPRAATSQDHLQKVRNAMEQEVRTKAREAAERAKLLPDELKERRTSQDGGR
jgi:tetratricopeptide (TPR) repeat protein